MQNGTAPERKYVLTKIGPGDYLLPSNDAQTIWRITRYIDGPSQGLDIPRDREFWGAWRWTGRREACDVHPDAWDRWFLSVTSCRTRAEAIREALR